MRLFATAPDFKESFTRYQVEHISGKTSGTQYSAPKCDTLVSTGVCPGPNALCRLIKHPISYYRVMAESERPTASRMERILLAALDRESYPKKLLEDNMIRLKDFKFDYLDNLLEPTDYIIDFIKFKIAIDRMSAPMIDGATLDWKVEGINEEFTFRNPNEQNRCGCGVSAIF